MAENSQSKALSAAAAILNYKNRSSGQLRDKLKEKGFEEEDIDYALQTLQGYGYLNDLEYALGIVRSGLAKCHGRGRIERKLKENKVPEEIIAEALDTYETDIDALCRLIEKNAADFHDPREKNKLCGKLLRLGYSYSEINQALRRFSEEVYED